MKIETIDDVLLTKLQALYDVETEITAALPKMAKAAENKQLRALFEKHLKETKEQSKRLEQAFKEIGQNPEKLEVEGIRGIIEDGEWVMKQGAEPPLGDAMLVSAALYVEHYEMAGYEGAIEFARKAKQPKIVKLLQATLKEEKNAATKLTKMVKQMMK